MYIPNLWLNEMTECAEMTNMKFKEKKERGKKKTKKYMTCQKSQNCVKQICFSSRFRVYSKTVDIKLFS